MPRTHHAASAYRLACGCVAEFTGILSGSARERELLCASCRAPTVITFRYPPCRQSCTVTCVADKPGGGVTRARCCLPRGHDGSRHFDESVSLWYELPRRLASRQGGLPAVHAYYESARQSRWARAAGSGEGPSC